MKNHVDLKMFLQQNLTPDKKKTICWQAQWGLRNTWEAWRELCVLATETLDDQSRQLSLREGLQRYSKRTVKENLPQALWAV